VSSSPVVVAAVCPCVGVISGCVTDGGSGSDGSGSGSKDSRIVCCPAVSAMTCVYAVGGGGGRGASKGVGSVTATHRANFYLHRVSEKPSHCYFFE